MFSEPVGDPMRPTAGVAHALAQPENSQLGGPRETCLDRSDEAPEMGREHGLIPIFRAWRADPMFPFIKVA